MEEVSTDVINLTADILIAKDKSEWQMAIDSYVKAGKTEGEAFGLALADQAAAMGLDFLGGTISGSVMSSGGVAINRISNQVQYARDGSAIMDAEGGVDALRQLANKMAGVSSEDMRNAITKQTGKIDKKETARRVGKLFNTVNTASNQANTADIAKSLTRKGFNEKTANDIAKAIVASNSGQSLTKEQQKLLESVKDNKSVQDAVSNIVANPMSTMGQRSQNIRTFENDIRAGVISKKTGVSMDVARKIAEGEVTQQEESLPENSYEVSADGKTIDKDGNLVTIEGVASIENGRMVLQTESGTVDAKDVIYGSQSEALVYEAVANLGDIIDTETANKLAEHLMKLGETSSEGYVQGIVEAYRYGYYGYGRDKMTGEKAMAATLTEKQRNVAYGRGQWYRDAQTKAEQAKKTAEKKGSSKKDDGVFFQNDKGEVVSYDESGVKTDAKRESGVQTAKVLKKLGLGGRFVFFESHRNEQGEWVYTDTDGNVVEAPNGMYYKDGTIYVDLNAGKGGAGLTLFTLSHELTHFIQQWSPAKYKALADFLIREYEKTGMDVDTLVHAKQQDLSNKRGKEVSYDEAFHEMVADSMEKMFADGNLVQKLMKLKAQDNSLFGKIKGFVDKLARKIRWYYGSLNPDSFEGRMVGQMTDAIGEIQDKFAEALVEASENYQTAEKNTTHEGEVKMQIREIIGESGKSYGVGVYLDSDVLTNVPDEQREAVVRRQLKKFGGRSFVAYDREGNPQEITVASSDQRFKNAKGRSVPVNEHITSFLRNPIKQEALVLVDEVIATSSFDSKEAAKHPHDWLDDNGKNQWDVWTVFIQEKNKAVWEATLKVANTTNGEKILYELYPIKEVEAARKPGTSSTKATVTHQKPVVNPEPKEKWSQHSLPEIKEKFSLREPVEQTKNLVALHNLTVDKLAKALDLGGFPMPSIAITKADIPHTNFGDITLVFGRETIDPKTNRKNTVYSADAWTPTFPRTEYEENREVGNEIYKLLQKVERKLDDFFHSDLRRVYMDIEGTLNRYDGEEGLIQYAMDNYGLKAAYLEEQGMHIHKSVTQKEADLEFNPASAERYNRIADILGVESAEEIGAVNLKEARDEHGEELEAVLPGITKSPFRMSRIFSAVKAYLQSRNTGPVYETVTDARATQKSVDDALDQAAYEAWVRKLFAGIVKDSGIYNQKPIFTPSGSRRSFKQTHLPVTLENIVKAMAAQNGGSTKNVSGFNGIKTLRAATAERFKSVDDMHKREGRLQNLTPEQMEAVNDALQSRLYNIIKSIDYENGCEGSDNSLFRYDTIGETITEISESGKFNVSDIQQTFGKYGKEVSDDTALELKQLLFDVAQMPVNIFEAKPERVVRFDEVKAAILPKGTNQSIVDGLLQNGVRIQFYEMNNDAERLQIVNSMEDVKFSDRATESVSNRSLLANAFEGVVQNDIERKRLQEYKDKIGLINAEEQKLRKLNEQIKELSFAKGPRDTKAIRDLQDEAKKTANRINIYDTQLLRLEASKPLQNVLEREKKKAYQRAEKKGKEALEAYREKAVKTQREMLDRWQESRKKGVESRHKTAMRHKIQNVVKELNDLLLNESKKRHVPDSLKKAVAAALDLVNMDTVGAEQRAAKYAELIAKETDQDKIDAYTVTMENILRKGEKMGQRLKELHDAYEEIANSDDPDIANAHDPMIAGAIKELSQTIGNTSIRDMTIEQLSDVYDMYKMVLTKVRDANKAMQDNIKENISDLATSVVGEVRVTGGEHKYRAAILDYVRKFGWNNLKPVYAFERIGSATLTKVFNNVRAGEDAWARDVTEARSYYLDKSKKYGYDSWDFKKKYRFESASGLEFELTLEQILSLYAYSKREQAHDHLRLGGFVFDSNIETYTEKGSKLLKYKVNTADAHQITPEILADITGKLTKEQMGFVDEMQDYLSTVMGAKGNEVTMKMYGVKLFKEKFYFPLKSAKQFMFEQNEVSGEVRIKNSGFTNKTVAKANNPVILSNFMDVWTGHVNDMSMYHAFTLPLEDFNRVFNYNSPKAEGRPAVSVKGTIQNAYSPAAVEYVKQLITDLNGGAMSDPRETFAKAMMSKFKKAKVMASLSVVIQQPSAIGRAFALVSPRFFQPTKDGMNHEQLWSELKKYAPVAVIKEMGYFDTNMGMSTKDFITAKEYTSFREKAKAIFTDGNFRDELLSKLPALADELTWCAIWNAVKRETVSTHTDLRPGSEEFLKAAGERFTEVVTKTQVYDSVLARSANMRSKSGMMNMATSFMAEPTTTINMLEDAIYKAKRGHKGYAAKVFASVATSIVLNNALVAIVYAARDDDEDETYLEKYVETFVSGIMDDFNPLTYYPFLKDAWSVLQGYDVERSDMSLISDLADSVKSLVKAYSSEDGDVAGAWWDLAGTVANIGGIPVQNIRREVKGAENFYNTLSLDLNGRKTTWGSMKDTLQKTVRNTLPVIGWLPGESKTDKLYDAIVSGDTAYVNRLKSGYKNQSAIDTAIRKALRENDPRIHEAAVARNNGDIAGYTRIAREIIGEGHFSQDDVVAAVNAEINAIDKGETTPAAQKASGLYKTEDFATAISQNDSAMANAIKVDIIQTAQKNGKTEEEALKGFNSSAKSELKEMFLNGNLSEDQAVSALVSFCGDEREDAEESVAEWAFESEHGFVYGDCKEMFLEGDISASELKSVIMDVEGKTSDEAGTKIVSYCREAYEDDYFSRSEAASIMVTYGGMTRAEAEDKLRYIDVKKQFPDTYVDDAWVTEYYKEVQSSGITIEVFVDYRNKVKGITGKDKKEMRMEVIDSLPISSAQKDALYLAEGWAKSTLKKAPWH